MNRPFFKAFLTVALAAVLAASETDAQSPKTPRLRIEAAPTKLYEGESFRLLVHLDNAESSTPPDTAYLESEFKVEYLGPQRRNSSRVTIINNVTKKEEDRGVTFSYLLTPKSAGKIEINPPEMTIDGKRLAANPVTVDVVAPSEQNLVRLEVSTDTANVYPLTPFQVTLSIFVRELPGEYAEADPVRDIAREVGAPALSISWADDALLPPGLVPRQSWQDWITPYQNNEGGFSVNGIRAGGPFDFGWAFGDRNQNLAQFLPKPKVVELPDKDGESVSWRRYDFTRTFTAEKIGPVVFDAVSLKGLFAVPAENGKLTTERVYTLSKPLEVEINDVPDEGRPNDYIGAFGQFDFNVDLVPTAARVGEAMTLTLTLKGKGSVLNVRAPNLESNEKIAENFKLYPPTEQTSDGNAQWTWSLRPLRDGKLEFPPLSVSYFDVAKEKYVTLQSDPIRLDVEKSAAVVSPVAGPAGVKASAPMERSAEGIFGNLPAPKGRMNRNLSFKTWCAAVGTVWGATLFLCVGTLVHRKRSASDTVRLSRAIQQSRETLDDGLARLTASRGANGGRTESTAAIRLILNAFLIPVADRFDARPDAVSSAELVHFLNRLAEADPSAGPRYREIAAQIERLEQIQYGSDPFDAESAADWKSLHSRWTDRLAALGPDKIPRPTRKRGAAAPFLLLFAALAALTVGCSGPMDGIARDQFAKALARFNSADAASADVKNDEKSGDENVEKNAQESNGLSARDGFLKSAATYEGLMKMGVVNGPILFNQGNAYYRAGDLPRALASWRRAEEFLPNDPYLRANIDSILPNGGVKKRPLFETVFFWQNHLTAATKGTLSLLFAISVCIGILTLLWNRGLSKRARKIGRRTLWALFALFLLASVSFLYDAARQAPNRHGILAVETPVRKGASTGYEPLYRDPAPALTEFTVLSRRDGWLEARFNDGQTGWVAEGESILW